MNTIERLEELAEKAGTVPWSYYEEDGSILDSTPEEILWVACDEDDDLGRLAVAAVNALPDLLKLARMAYGEHLKLPWHPDPCVTCDALMALFHEVPL